MSNGSYAPHGGLSSLLLGNGKTGGNRRKPGNRGKPGGKPGKPGTATNYTVSIMDFGWPADHPGVARIARAVLVGVPHHVTQRGNGRRPVFFTDHDRQIYLDALFDYAVRYSVRVWGYCLMTNHVHFIVVPETEAGLARTFGRAHADYARYANVAQRGSGHFWQARFFSCALDQDHAWKALAYVERNPVRAGLAGVAEEYEWSSAAAHCAEDDMDGRLDLGEWAGRYNGQRWREALKLGVNAEAWEERIREATRRGLPFGSDQFVEQMSKSAGRDLKVRPPGRPRKERPVGAEQVNG